MKKMLLIFLASFILLILVLLVFSFTGMPLSDKGSESRAEISGQAESSFVAETVSNSETIDFMFTPHSIEAKNYLLSYELKKDGTTIDQQQKRLVEMVSPDNPITIHTSRDNKSEYSLETIIYDADNPKIELHNDKIAIHPQEIKN